jgi:signal transduction histidine kinase
LFYAIALLAAAMRWISRASHEGDVLKGSVFVGVLIVSTALLHDLAIWFGYLEFDRFSLRAVIPTTIAVLIAAVLLERYRRAYRSLVKSNLELEERVAHRTEQLEQNYRRLQELELAQSVATERKRIVADMHDGLGGTLVRLLSVVKAGEVDRPILERELNHALVELQLSFDAMQDFDQDLLVLLGSVRHRLSPAFDRAGIHVQWQVDPLPRTAWLTPERSHNAQQLLLEIFTNTIRHAKAGKVCVAVCRTKDRRVQLRIEDDGVGFEVANQRTGRGLTTMQQRSEAIGARLTVERSIERGTIVVVIFPEALLEGAIKDAKPHSVSSSKPSDTNTEIDIGAPTIPETSAFTLDVPSGRAPVGSA